jgi:hypothetical protein
MLVDTGLLSYFLFKIWIRKRGRWRAGAEVEKRER